MEAAYVAIVSTTFKKFQDVKQTIESNQKKVTQIPLILITTVVRWLTVSISHRAQVFTTVVTKLFHPLLSLRSLLLQQTGEGEAVRSQVKRYIEDIVLHSLFHPDHLFEYSLAFSLKQNVVSSATTPPGTL
jgi:hypothetical protein